MQCLVFRFQNTILLSYNFLSIIDFGRPSKHHSLPSLLLAKALLPIGYSPLYNLTLPSISQACDYANCPLHMLICLYYAHGYSYTIILACFIVPFFVERYTNESSGLGHIAFTVYTIATVKACYGWICKELL